jgi:hypothetical protein
MQATFETATEAAWHAHAAGKAGHEVIRAHQSSSELAANARSKLPDLGDAAETTKLGSLERTPAPAKALVAGVADPSMLTTTLYTTIADKVCFGWEKVAL